MNLWAWTDTKSEPQPEMKAKANPDSSVKPANTQVKEGTPTKAPSGKFGPLGQFDMFVTGFAKQIAYRSRQKNTAELNRELTFFKIFIDVYDGKTKRFSFDQTDLQDIGYRFKVLSDCVYQVEWQTVIRIITCHEQSNHRPSGVLEKALAI